jgi:hypothetical protein
MNLSIGIISVVPQGSLTFRKKNFSWADGFISPPKEAVLRIFIALKSPLLSAGLELPNFGSSGKCDNHWTTDNDRADACAVFVQLRPRTVPQT